jgi:hypothetical protein
MSGRIRSFPLARRLLDVLAKARPLLEKMDVPVSVEAEGRRVADRLAERTAAVRGRGLNVCGIHLLISPSPGSAKIVWRQGVA